MRNLMKPKQPTAVLMYFWATSSTSFWGIIGRLPQTLGLSVQLTEKLSRDAPGSSTGQYLQTQNTRGRDLFKELTMAYLIRFRIKRVASILPLATMCILPSILD